MRQTAWHVLRAVTVLLSIAWAGVSPTIAQSCGDLDWTQRFFPGFVPSPRSGHAMCYDTLRHRVMLFGGRLADGTLSNGTWVYDGIAWTQLQTNGAPSAREQHAMVYDTDNDRVYLFGGLNTTAGALTNHTYEFNPQTSTWTQLFPTLSPSARKGHAMVYNPIRHRVVMTAGEVAGNVLSASTWEYDPTVNTWAQPVTVNPQARAGHAMCFDPVRGLVVLFGGRTNAESVAPATYSNAVWEFDGTLWTQRTDITTGRPFGRSGHSMAFDPVRGVCVIVAGRGDSNGDGVPDFSGATWFYDGMTFSQPPLFLGPTPRTEHAAAYDAMRERLVLFGGLTSATASSGPTLELGSIERPRIIAQPFSLTMDAGQSALFTVFDDGHQSTFQWFRWMDPITDGGLIAGANTRQLAINSAQDADAGEYWCRVSNPCGSTDSSPASLTILPSGGTPCPFDVNNDHRVNDADLAMLQGALGTLLGLPGYIPRADFDGDFDVDVNDEAALQNFLAAQGPTHCPGFECPGDFNVDGMADADDLFAFLDAWFAQNGMNGAGLSADVDHSGGVDADDLFAFLDTWFEHNGSTCP